MPQVLPFIFAAAAGGGTSGAIAALFVSAIVSAGMASNAEAKQRRRTQEAIRSRNITLRSAMAARTIVLGTARTSGPLMYAEFVGATQEYLDTIVAINAGEIGEVVGVYIGDEYIAASAITSSYPTSGKYAVSTLDSPSVEESFSVTGATSVTLNNTPDTPAVSALIHSTGSGDNLNQQPVTPTSVVGAVVSWATAFTGTVTVVYRSAGAIRAPLRVQWAMGTAAQASTTWSAVSTPRWTSNHRLRGVAYVRTLKLIDDPLFLAGDNGDVGAVIRGPAGVYDPRTLTTLTHSSNPALLAAWYRTLAVADGGMGVPSAWIDWATVATAANICDELISVRKLDNTGYENVKRYECNTRLSLDAAPADNLQIILDCMAGDFPFTAGVYKCFAGAFRTATITLTDDDVLASETIAIVPQAGASVAPPNIVTGTFYDRARNWVQQPAAAVTNATYVTADGAEEILEMDLQGTTDERQANYLMGVHLERNRPSLAAMLTVTGKGANLGLLDTVQINLTGYSAIAGKTFEVRRRTNNWTGRYPLELREIKAATYTLDADRFTAAAAVSPPVNSALFDVTAPAPTAAVEQLVRQADGSIISVAEVTWSSHPQSFVRERGSIRLRWKRATAAEWSYGSPLSGAAVKGTTGALVDGAVVQIEVQATNGAGASSVWVAAPLVTVVGKSARPADVLSFGYTASEAGLELSWAPATDVDYDSTIIKSGATWAAATTLFRGAASRWTWPRPASGSYTLLAKHVDSSGNEGLNAASLTIAYTSTPVANANISVDAGGALQGIGAGAGTVVRNAQVTINANGTLGGAGSGQASLTSLPGTVATAQIADAALTTAKFASGIEPVTVVAGSTVPTTKSTTTIVLTGTGKLYRWSGTAYVASVATADLAGTIADAQIAGMAASKVTGQLSDTQLAAIGAAKVTGQIVGTQITDGAISTAKLSAGSVTAAVIAADTITAAQIAANAITSAELAAGAVVAGKIAAGSIQAGDIAAGTITGDRIAANTITASQIAADTITAGQIAAGAISASEIAAGAIRAQHILVAPKSLNLDPSFEGGAASWSGFVQRLPRSNASVPASCPAPFAAQFSNRDNPSFASIDVNPGEVYRASCWVNRGTGGGGAGLGVFGAVQGPDGSTVESFDWPGASTNATGWVRVTGLYTVPATGARLLFGAWADRTSYAGEAWYADLTVERAADASLIVDGAVTASKIQTDLLSADNVLTRGLTVRDNSGNVLLSAGQPLAAANITPAAGWLNSNVSLGGLGFTGDTNATYGAVAGTTLRDSNGRTISDARLLGSILDSTAWVPDSSGDQPGFNANGTSSGGGNLILYDSLPDGSRGLLWRARSGSATTGNPEGGWNGVSFNVNSAQMYRFSVWIRCFGGNASGNFYLGLGGNTVHDIGGGVNSNPYFQVLGRSNVADSQWVLVVGYVYPSSYSGTQYNRGGVYRASDGVKIVDGTDFKWAPGATSTNHRAYQYYTTQANNYQDFWNPRVDLMDGTEPSLDALLAGGKAADAATRATWSLVTSRPTELTDGRVATAISASGVLISRVAPGALAAPSASGLYLGSDYLGYYNSGTASWRTYMDNAGNFFLGGSGGALTWSSGVLNINGTLKVGSSPAVSGTTMTGSGGVINTGGTFALGNATTNISYNGSQLTLNGAIVTAANLNLTALSLSANTPSSSSFAKNDGITRTLGTVTVTASGGTTPYTYTWVLTDIEIDQGSGINDVDNAGNISATGNVCSYTARGDTDCAISVSAVCFVTDAKGFTASIGRTCSGTFGSGPP